MIAFLARLFPMKSDPTRVSSDWLRAQERQDERAGWREAPQVDWSLRHWTGRRRQPKAEAQNGRYL